MGLGISPQIHRKVTGAGGAGEKPPGLPTWKAHHPFHDQCLSARSARCCHWSGTALGIDLIMRGGSWKEQR
jgi:hypothetical protein